MRRATPRSVARRARSPSPKASPCAPDAGGGRRTLRRSAACIARSRPAVSSTSCTRSSARARMPDAAVKAAIKVSEPERELALAETRAVLAAAASDEYREELLELEEALEDGLLDDRHALTLEPILELALQAGRIRGIYGPPGETAALRLYRKLPRGVALQESAREVSEALSSLQGHTLEGASLTAVGPGAYTLSIATAEGRLSVKLDRQGARITSVEV